MFYKIKGNFSSNPCILSIFYLVQSKNRLIDKQDNQSIKVLHSSFPPIKQLQSAKIILGHPKHEIISILGWSLLLLIAPNHSCFLLFILKFYSYNYSICYSILSFSLLQAISVPLLFAIAFKREGDKPIVGGCNS